MASHVVVISTTFQTTKVKVSPGKYMTDVVEEACKQLRITNKTYSLKHNNRTLDLTRTFRETGLPPGAKLALVVISSSPSVVSVALRVPESIGVPGGRLMDKFRSDTSLWKVLRKFESIEGKNFDFTGRADTKIESGQVSGPGRIFYEEPVLRILKREVSGVADLSRSLAQYGVNDGSVMIELSFRPTQTPLEEAMTQIAEFFKEEAPEESTEPTSEASTTVVDPSVESRNNETLVDSAGGADDVMEDISGLAESRESGAQDNDQRVSESATTNRALQAPSQESSLVLIGRNGRPITVYAAPSSTMPKAAQAPHNEKDYEPTIAHAQSVMGRLQSNTQNQQLPSDAEIERREREAAAKLAAIGEVMIKVTFPDQTNISFVFTADDSANDMYQHVKDAISAEDQPFKLKGFMRTHLMEDVPRTSKKLIKDLGFKGRSRLTFMWEEKASDEARKQPTLKAHYLAVAQEIAIPVVETEEDTKEDGAGSSGNAPKKDTSGSGKGGGGLKNIGKLFPGLKKK